MKRFLIGIFLCACLVVQLRGLSVPTEYARVGEKLPFRLIQSGNPVSELPNDCLTAFIVSVTCPHCSRLADSVSGSETGEEPLWFVLEGPEEVKEFMVGHSLRPNLVFSISQPRHRWFFPGAAVSVPFTPMRVVLDRNLVVRHLSQSHEIPAEQERNALCAS
jgi:hypothetical protein